MWHHSSGHAEAASCIAQPEAFTTRIYNCMPRELWGEEGKKNEDWQQMLAQVPMFKKRKKKNPSLVLTSHVIWDVLLALSQFPLPYLLNEDSNLRTDVRINEIMHVK